MKKILLSLALAVAALLPAQSQPYMHLPDSSVIWQSLTLFELGGGGYSYAYTLSENRDTLINGKIYTKIFAPFLNNAFCGGYRSTDSGKVFFYDYTYDAESIIYDFSVNQGDTFTVTYSDCPISFNGGGGSQ